MGFSAETFVAQVFEIKRLCKVLYGENGEANALTYALAIMTEEQISKMLEKIQADYVNWYGQKP